MSNASTLPARMTVVAISGPGGPRVLKPDGFFTEPGGQHTPAETAVL